MSKNSLLYFVDSRNIDATLWIIISGVKVSQLNPSITPAYCQWNSAAVFNREGVEIIMGMFRVLSVDVNKSYLSTSVITGNSRVANTRNTLVRLLCLCV